MAVLKLLIELGWFDVVVVCAVSIFILYKSINRPKKPTKSSEISLDRRHKDKKKNSQESEDEYGDEKVPHSEEETKNIELPSKSESSVNVRKQNADPKGPLDAESASVDYLKVDDSKPAPQKSSSAKIASFSDDVTPLTEVNKGINSSSAISQKPAGCNSGQEKLKQIRDEFLEMATFFDWFKRGLIGIVKLKNANISKLLGAVVDFNKEVGIYVRNNLNHELPIQTAIKVLQNFQHLFIIIKEPADVNSGRIFSVRGGLSFFSLACYMLSEGFRKLADGAEVSFADGSDDRWKRVKNEIKADLKSLLKMLKGTDKTAMIKIEEIVEGLNVATEQFSDEVLKFNEL